MKTYPFAVVALSLSSFFTFAAVAVGCGSSNSSNPPAEDSGAVAESGTRMTPDSGTTMDSGTEKGDSSTEADTGPTMLSCPVMDAGFPDGYPADHNALPSVVYGGAGVLAKPEVVTVTFPGDTLQTQLEHFGDDVLDTCWWDAVRQGYCETGGVTCVGQGVAAAKPHVEMTTAPAASYTDSSQGGASTLQTFIQQQVANGTFPAPTAGTVYVLYFPSSTTVTLDGATSCSTFGGYHTSTTVTPPGGSATQVAYAVVPRCGTEGLFSSQLDELTFSASHELSEAATDPFVTASGGSGYYLDGTNQDYIAWNFFPSGGEVADLCVDLLGESTGTPHDSVTAMGAHGSYMVQRIWSVGAAAAGGDPCVPLANEPYFNLAPAKGYGTQVLPAVGDSVTFPANAFATGPTGGAWAIAGYDLGNLFYGLPQQLEITLSGEPDGGSVAAASNGDTVYVTIKVVGAFQNIPGTNFPGAVYFLESTSNTGRHAWPGLIVPSSAGL